jgi:hypothetical protein
MQLVSIDGLLDFGALMRATGSPRGEMTKIAPSGGMQMKRLPSVSIVSPSGPVLPFVETGVSADTGWLTEARDLGRRAVLVEGAAPDRVVSCHGDVENLLSA